MRGCIMLHIKSTSQVCRNRVKFSDPSANMRISKSELQVTTIKVNIMRDNSFDTFSGGILVVSKEPNFR